MKELKQQLASALLVIVTVATFIAAAINFQQQSKFHLPDDGITWVDRSSVDEGRGEGQNSSVVALYIAKGSPGEKAGIHKNDRLVSISGVTIQRALDVTAVLARLGAWKKADYTVLHGRTEVVSSVIIGEAERDSTIYYQYAVGFVYLSIGLFVYFRRGAAPRALHFFLLCLASFVLYSFHYSGKLNNFDKIIYLGNLLAGFLAPTLFLHFCLVFPSGSESKDGAETKNSRDGKDAPDARKSSRAAQPIHSIPKWLTVLVYLPGTVLLVLQLAFVSGWMTTSALLEMRWLLDRVWLGFLSIMYLAGAAVLTWQLRRSEDPVVRRQLTWLRNGAVVGIVPFAMFYVIPYMTGIPPNHLTNLSVLALPVIPLTWAYAILRYRLMDVDIIFQEGYVYTLATLSVLAIFYGLIFSVSKASDLNGTTLLALILIAAFVFQPIRSWIQQQLDRHYFYKDRYDYRRTLIEFARELGSPTDLGEMLESVADRLIRTLGIRHVAFFVADPAQNNGAGGFRLEHAGNRHGSRTASVPSGLDLSFLSGETGRPYLFFERTRGMLDVVSQNTFTPGARQSIAQLDCTYYMPCAARGKTIAYLGVSRTEAGDFLSSDDIELLLTLSGYVGIAVDNAVLYRSLERKVEEYERLKEFSENIVESIHVGILAADLDDCVESWNSQIERLTGIERGHAVGRKLGELLPSDLCEALAANSLNGGIHNIYKYVLKPQTLNPDASQQNDPGPVTLNIAVAPLFSREGSHIGRLIIFEDITDRAELERRLVQADKLSSMGLLAAGVAHEVNTPLAVISTYAQMLAKQIAGDAEKAPLLEKIARQTFRASEIVNSLLNFSRTATTDFVNVELNKVVRETLGLVEHQLKQARVQVELDLDGQLPRIKGNAGKLQQVFLNLFLNARDAMEPGGTLTIRSRRTPEGLVRVSVADTGAGITPEALSRIFDPFYTTKAARKGTGLGLSISYGIVQEHGGDIEVVSNAGAGARFELSFPELTASGAMAHATTAPALTPAGLTPAALKAQELKRPEPAIAVLN